MAVCKETAAQSLEPGVDCYLRPVGSAPNPEAMGVGAQDTKIHNRRGALGLAPRLFRPPDGRDEEAFA